MLFMHLEARKVFSLGISTHSPSKQYIISPSPSHRIDLTHCDHQDSFRVRVITETQSSYFSYELQE